MPAEASAQMKVFAKGSGVMILQLNSSASDHEGVHNVEVRSAGPPPSARHALTRPQGLVPERLMNVILAMHWQTG